MTSRDFVFWLQGYFEILTIGLATTVKDSVPLDEKQVTCIKNHLTLVFKHKINPSYGGAQEELQQIHDGHDDPDHDAWCPEAPWVYDTPTMRC